MRGFLVLLHIVCLIAQKQYSYNYDATPTQGNPLVGFMPYASGSQFEFKNQQSDATFPHSMENFYITMRSLNTGANTYDWSALESILNGCVSRGNQGVGRVYLDYPGKTLKPSDAVPDYLIPGLTFYSYTEYGGGVSPDWENSTLGDAMVSLIQAMAKKYDGDNRIAFWQVGFLGHWAEWHDEQIAFASTSVQARILNAFNDNWKYTQLLVRYPDVTGGIPASSLRIGFHDDSFGQDTLYPDSSWSFTNQMVQGNATDRWKVVPIGGELRPELQLCIFEDDPATACASTGLVAQPFDECVTETHASWLWDSAAWNPGYPSSSYNNALNGALSMGYQFYVSQISVSALNTSTNSFQVDVFLQNKGVAPFYYPLNLMAKYNSYEGIFVNVQYLLPSDQPTKYSLTIPYTTTSSISIFLASPQGFLLKPVVFAIANANTNGIITVNSP